MPPDQIPGTDVFTDSKWSDRQNKSFAQAELNILKKKEEWNKAHPNAKILPFPDGTGWYLASGPQAQGGDLPEDTPPVVYTDLKTQQQFWEYTDNITGRKSYDRYDPKEPEPPATSKDAIHVESTTYDKHTNTNVTELTNGTILTERAKELDPSIFLSESEANQEIVNQGQVGKWQAQWEPGVGYSIQRIDDQEAKIAPGEIKVANKIPAGTNRELWVLNNGDSFHVDLDKSDPKVSYSHSITEGGLDLAVLTDGTRLPVNTKKIPPDQIDVAKTITHQDGTQTIILDDGTKINVGREISQPATATTKQVTIGSQKFVQVTQPDGSIELREVPDDLPDGETEVVIRGGREFVQVTQPNGQITSRELGPPARPPTEARVLDVAGRPFIQDTSGNLQPLPLLNMEQIITRAILNNDWEAAVALDDFRNRPTSSEALQAALQFSRSPTDAAVVSALARGEPGIVEQDFQAGADVQALGGVRRIGPQPEFLQTAYQRFQDSLLAGRPPTVEELLEDIPSEGPSREEQLIEGLQQDLENLTQSLRIGGDISTATGVRGAVTPQIPTMGDTTGIPDTTDTTGTTGTPAATEATDEIGMLIRLLEEAGVPGVPDLVNDLGSTEGLDYESVVTALERMLLETQATQPVGGIPDGVADRILGKDPLGLTPLAAGARAGAEAEMDQLVREFEAAEETKRRAAAEKQAEAEFIAEVYPLDSPSMTGAQRGAISRKQQLEGMEAAVTAAEGDKEKQRRQEMEADFPTTAGGAGSFMQNVMRLEQDPLGLEKGGIAGHNLEIVGEAGPELVDLPAGTQVTPISDLTTKELAKLKEEGMEGFQEGGLVTNPSAFPLGIRQLLSGSVIAPARSVFPVAGLRVPSQQAQRRLLPSELSFLRGLGEEAGISGDLFSRELASTRPGRSGKRARFLAEVAN